MNTKAILAYAVEHYPEHKSERVEWIDDTSCNLLYATPAIARAALLSLTASESTFPPLALRPTKPSSASPDSHLQARIATPTDVKAPGARERSRYYLFHPEEEPTYERRAYNNRENDSRRRNDRENKYTEDMYDDDSSARERQRSRSPRERRRSRSPIERRTWSRSPPRRRSRSRSAPRNRGKELFPSRAKGAVMDSYPAPAVESRGGKKELFPASTGPKELFPAQKELFPQKVVGRAMMDTFVAPPKHHNPDEWNPHGAVEVLEERKPRSLADRIQLPARSLAERIQFPDEVGGSDDSFARKMAGSKGEGLPDGGRRQRGGRSRAEDFLG